MVSATKQALAETRSEDTGLILNGAIAGVVGGLVIAGVGMALSAARGTGFWSLPNGIAGIAVGPANGATRDFGLVTLEGVILHMVLSAILGIVTLYAIRRITREYLWTGVACGVAFWIFNYYVVGLAIPGAHALANLNPVWMGGGLHVLFGAVTGIVAKRMDSVR